jgi:hypothetical protein
VKYTIAAHPTRYNGVEFRSRLEAHWAAFFDEVAAYNANSGWRYEPVDLDGWTPDFAYRNKSPWYFAEVKPTESIEEFPLEKIARAWCQPGVDHFGTEHEGEIVMLLGLNGWHTFWNTRTRQEERLWCMCDAESELWKRAGNLVQWRPNK